MTEEPIQEGDKPLSRRAFIGAAAGGIGVIAVGALVAGMHGDGAGDKIAEVAKAESICEKAAETPADERFVIHVAGGVEATQAYGRDTAMRHMLTNAAAVAYPVTNEQSYTYTVQDDSCFRSDLTPDVVLFASSSASADYLAGGTRTMQWEVPAAGGDRPRHRSGAGIRRAAAPMARKPLRQRIRLARGQ